jgi:thiol-disulfide isomerase/thioredoxin
MDHHSNNCMLTAFAFIKQYYEDEGKNVLIFCSNGVSKSAVVFIYFMMRRYKLSFRAVLDKLMTMRPKIRLRPELKVLVNAPTLLERSGNSITVVWEPLEGKNKVYELQILELGESVDEEPEEAYRTLTKTLAMNIAKKKNLISGQRYRFRIRYYDNNDACHSGYSLPSDALSVVCDPLSQLDPPTLRPAEADSLIISWCKPDGNADGYQLRYRQDDQIEWTMIGSGKTLTGNEVKKKNLAQKHEYFFSVRPIISSESDGNRSYEWSASASGTPQVEFAPGIARVFPKTLVRKSMDTVQTRDALADKAILLYFSAHWCGPCRKFTPELASKYAEWKRAGKAIEVVFCSLDQQQEEYENYYKSDMPWLSIPWSSEQREAFPNQFGVKGIPQLVVIGRTGAVLNGNAVQEIMGQDHMVLADRWAA